MEIKFYKRKYFGRIDLYAVDEEQATAIRMLTGSKAFSTHTKKALELLGIVFTEVVDPE